MEVSSVVARFVVDAYWFHTAGKLASAYLRFYGTPVHDATAMRHAPTGECVRMLKTYPDARILYVRPGAS